MSSGICRHTLHHPLRTADTTARPELRLLFVWLGNRCGCPRIAAASLKSYMNGTGPNIEIFKPFGDAFEVMKKILFQPFDIKKWLVIGFAAWLANLGSGGGGGFNFPYNEREDTHKLNEMIGQIPQPILVTGVCILGAFVLLLIVVVAWLRARGRFIFVDCIVRNRAAIAEPWKEFRKEGNSLFLFSLVVVLTLIGLAIVGTFALALPLIIRGSSSQPGPGLLIAFSLFLICLVSLVFIFAVVTQLMVPMMYRQRCRARHAFAQVVDLVASHPGPILLYVLFLLLLGVAMVVISCAVVCATCCIAAIPYVGTVILLPIPVTLGAFSLLFLRQFGPDYDVWGGIIPPEFLPVLMPPPSPPVNQAG